MSKAKKIDDPPLYEFSGEPGPFSYRFISAVNVDVYPSFIRLTFEADDTDRYLTPPTIDIYKKKGKMRWRRVR